MYNNIKFRIQTVFNAAAEKYDRHESSFFSHFGRRAVELANIPSGSKVLDIGTGRGALLFPAINRVGYNRARSSKNLTTTLGCTNIKVL